MYRVAMPLLITSFEGSEGFGLQGNDLSNHGVRGVPQGSSSQQIVVLARRSLSLS
jgi:hypothetical protein